MPDSNDNKPPRGVELSDADDFSDVHIAPTQITATSNKEATPIQTGDDFSLDITFEDDVSSSSSPPSQENLLVNDSEFRSGSDLSQLPTHQFQGGGIELSSESPLIEGNPTTIIGRLRRTTAAPGTLDPLPVTILQRLGYLINSLIAIGAVALMLLGVTIHLTGGTIDYRAASIEEFKNRLIGHGSEAIIRDGVSLISARSIVYPITTPQGDRENALIIFGEIKNTTDRPSPPLSLKLNLDNGSAVGIQQTIPLGFSLKSFELNALRKKEDFQARVERFGRQLNAGRLEPNSTASYSFVLLSPPAGAKSWSYDISLEPYAQPIPKKEPPSVAPEPQISPPSPELKEVSPKKKSKKRRMRRKQPKKNSSN